MMRNSLVPRLCAPLALIAALGCGELEGKSSSSSPATNPAPVGTATGVTTTTPAPAPAVTPAVPVTQTPAVLPTHNAQVVGQTTTSASAGQVAQPIIASTPGTITSTSTTTAAVDPQQAPEANPNSGSNAFLNDLGTFGAVAGGIVAGAAISSLFSGGGYGYGPCCCCDPYGNPYY